MVPYSTSGNAWPHPELITLSFEPDGTNLGYPSNLFATFNAKFGSAATWENQILKAAQIVTNTSTGLITGTFTGLDEGMVFTQGGFVFQITYQGGTGGSSVVLMRLA